MGKQHELTALLACADQISGCKPTCVICMLADQLAPSPLLPQLPSVSIKRLLNLTNPAWMSVKLVMVGAHEARHHKLHQSLLPEFICS